MLVLIQMGTRMASAYKSLLILWKHFLGYLVYEIFLWPESWRGSLHIYLLSFPRFWILSIERFWFLFWSILNGVTLKTSNWGIFGFTICAWVERYFCKFKMASRSWVTTHPWSRLESSYRVGQIFERIGWKCHHVFGAQIWNGLAFKFLYG